MYVASPQLIVPNDKGLLTNLEFLKIPEANVQSHIYNSCPVISSGLGTKLWFLRL